MKIRLLGTGTSQGIPCIGCTCAVCLSSDKKDKRLRASAHIEAQGQSIVIDTGPDFRQQMLRAQVQHLDAVLFTHQHKDHTAGLDDIRGFNFAQKKAIPLYGRPSVLAQLRQEFAYIFDTGYKYPGLPQVELLELNGTAFSVGKLCIQPIEGLHARLPVYGFRIGDFCYMTDVNYLSYASKSQMKGCRVIVLSALRQKPHPSHYTLAEACEILKELAPEMGYLTHISHLMGTHAAVSPTLPPGIQLAYDGLEIQL